MAMEAAVWRRVVEPNALLDPGPPKRGLPHPTAEVVAPEDITLGRGKDVRGGVRGEVLGESLAEEPGKPHGSPLPGLGGDEVDLAAHLRQRLADVDGSLQQVQAIKPQGGELAPAEPRETSHGDEGPVAGRHGRFSRPTSSDGPEKGARRTLPVDKASPAQHASCSRCPPQIDVNDYFFEVENVGEAFPEFESITRVWIDGQPVKVRTPSPWDVDDPVEGLVMMLLSGCHLWVPFPQEQDARMAEHREGQQRAEEDRRAGRVVASGF